MQVTLLYDENDVGYEYDSNRRSSYEKVNMHRLVNYLIYKSKKNIAEKYEKVHRRNIVFLKI